MDCVDNMNFSIRNCLNFPLKSMDIRCFIPYVIGHILTFVRILLKQTEFSTYSRWKLWKTNGAVELSTVSLWMNWTKVWYSGLELDFLIQSPSFGANIYWRRLHRGQRITNIGAFYVEKQRGLNKAKKEFTVMV